MILQQPTLNSWANDRKFEVYKTRAERDAERNTYHPTGFVPFSNNFLSTKIFYRTTGASSYRPSSYYTSASDRPVTGLRRPEESYTSSTNYGRYDGRSSLFEFTSKLINFSYFQQHPATTNTQFQRLWLKIKLQV